VPEALETRPSKDEVVALLAEEWGSIDRLVSGLSDQEWSTPALPGWDVHDVLAHIVGTERMLSGVEPPPITEGTDEGAHVRNPIGQSNERWIVGLRSRSHGELLSDFREVTADRLQTLRSMPEEEFRAPSWTPAGQADYGRFMEIRIFDCYVHEQDIRGALGRPGHEGGPVAEMALREVTLALGYIVGKRVGASEGDRVTIDLTGPIERSLHVVVDGRARVVPTLEGAPTASITLPSPLFLRLAAGRVEPGSVADQVARSGDAELSERLAGNLAFTI